MWLFAPNISCTHGFSTRHGGISPAPFDTLNLGGSEDSDSNILQNRTIALKALGLSIDKLCNLKQVHGNHVNVAKCGKQEGDALVSNKKGEVLAVSIADCYPIIFHDPVNGVIGAAHAGWRGTVNMIAEKTFNEMKKLGATATTTQVAIGQGISLKNFEVGEEVLAEFKNKGFPSSVHQNKHIDLIACNQFVLADSGIPAKNIWTMSRCTFEKDFFSYRRDKGLTGRMWALISL